MSSERTKTSTRGGSGSTRGASNRISKSNRNSNRYNTNKNGSVVLTVAASKGEEAKESETQYRQTSNEGGQQQATVILANQGLHFQFHEASRSS